MRQAAIAKLSSFSSPAEVSYIVKRLVGGLASDRPLVRPTFGAALTTLLGLGGGADDSGDNSGDNSSDNSGANSGDNSASLALALKKAKELEICGLPKEKRNAALGRIAVYASIFK